MASRAVKVSDRPRVLLDQRRLKMAESAHAYVRGNTVKFYEWLSSVKAARLIPKGPAVWICGDCHIGNLGPVANADGKIEIQIRDLDQTVIGNPAHDLIRLSLSLAMAGRSSDLPGVTTARMIERVIEAYGRALLGKTDQVDEDEVSPIKSVMRESRRRRWEHLAEERIEDVKPTIPLGKKFWALSKVEQKEIAEMFGQEPVRALVTQLKGRHDDAPIKVLDAAYWMKGCSSLGRLRYAVLVGVGKRHADGFSLVDIKEATAAASPRYRRAVMPHTNAERVVSGARALSPFLGERMLASHLGGKSVVVRELMPQDLKFEMEGLTAEDAVGAAGLFAGVVGRAHARQMDKPTRTAWAKVIAANHAGTMQVPSWLWSSVVDLVAVHEAAYLEHCRQYALKG